MFYNACATNFGSNLFVRFNWNRKITACILPAYWLQAVLFCLNSVGMV
nr:MAG TPA: hypothetical protein [Caudoviricetes sp.]